MRNLSGRGWDRSWRAESAAMAALFFRVFNFAQTFRRQGTNVVARMGFGATEGCHDRRATLLHERGGMPVSSRTTRCVESWSDTRDHGLLAVAGAQQLAVDELLAIWSEVSSSDALVDARRWRFQYPLAKSRRHRR